MIFGVAIIPTIMQITTMVFLTRNSPVSMGYMYWAFVIWPTLWRGGHPWVDLHQSYACLSVSDAITASSAAASAAHSTFLLAEDQSL